jgi:hypothetical protein
MSRQLKVGDYVRNICSCDNCRLIDQSTGAILQVVGFTVVDDYDRIKAYFPIVCDIRQKTANPNREDHYYFSPEELLFLHEGTFSEGKV